MSLFPHRTTTGGVMLALLCVLAAALGLPVGARSASTGVGAPVDKVPDSACFGAASRDPLHHCRDPKLRLTVVPTPSDALLEPNGRCTPVGQTRVLLPCAFGVAAGRAQDTIALVGDSHASHWRAAVEAVAQARDWHGVSLTHSGCPFSKAVAALEGANRGECRAWNRAVLRWFRAHPEVHTVFVSEHSGGRVDVPAGSTPRATQIRGYRAVWQALPANVTRIIVIRDTPRNGSATSDCVERAMAARIPAGPKCAVRRSAALRPDPAVAAARRTPGDRVRVADLTSFFCSARLCLPVIGGALVHKDIDHLTQTYAATLGPYLLRQVEAAGIPDPPAGGAGPVPG